MAAAKNLIVKEKKSIKNIAVIGCGLHFCERYHPVLEETMIKNGLTIILAVDLDSQKNRIMSFFDQKKLIPQNFIFFKEENRNAPNTEKMDEVIKPFIKKYGIEGVLICTEPKVHAVYALWAIDNGVHVFMDKPLSAFKSLDESENIIRDFTLINKKLKQTDLNLVLSCERRLHQGYNFIIDYLKKIINDYKIPITYIDIHFGGGMWNMPSEYFSRENHPYKYGYGVLLHSGYHYIDLLVNLLKLNNVLHKNYIDPASITTHSIFPKDQMNVINNENYNKILSTDKFKPYFLETSLQAMNLFGETDVTITGQLKNSKGAISGYSLKLLESSASNRNWAELPENTYINNGRIRQDTIIIHVGPICSIHIKSFSLNKDKTTNEIEDFNIDIINNINVTGNSQLIHINRKDLSELFPELPIHHSMNVKSRQQQLLDFLNHKDGNSGLSSHQESIEFLNEVFKKIREGKINKANSH